MPAQAGAETTSLCSADVETSNCSPANVVTHVHFVAGETKIDPKEEEILYSPGATFLTNLGNVKCYILFLGDAGELGSPLVIKGHFTFVKCNEGKCSVLEVSELAVAKILKTGTELATFAFETEFRVECKSMFINCVYNGENLQGQVLGGLSSGSERLLTYITFSEEEMHQVSGSLCPNKKKLDASFASLEALFIRN
jgi:hypothetical protein